MNTYGAFLKKLIHFTNIKLSTLADVVDYDTSYISKWCNKDKLPAAKASSAVNKSLADTFAAEILSQNELQVFLNKFKIEEPVTDALLPDVIYRMLSAAYKDSYDSAHDPVRTGMAGADRVLIWQPDIANFFTQELPRLITDRHSDTQILCTMDTAALLRELHLESFSAAEAPQFEVQVRIGLNIDSVKKYPQDIWQLYYFINKYNFVNFDFYSNESMGRTNLLVVRDLIAVLCSVDENERITVASIITDLSIVNALYQKILPLFSSNYLAVHSADAGEILYNGYRTEFYAHSSFQMFVTKGFEFLLPPSMNEKLKNAAKEQGFDERTEKVVQQISIALHELFENGQIDFFLLKSRLISYISDGTIYYADVPYKMSADEIREHMDHVLGLVEKNPNIHFHIIDDDYLQDSDHLLRMSIYSNRRKIFLKNIEKISSSGGPKFYTIMNDQLITAVADVFDALPESEHVYNYDYEKLKQFIARYGNMIERMISMNHRQD